MITLARAQRDVEAARKRVLRWERVITLAAVRWIQDGSRSWSGRFAREVGRRASIRHRMAVKKLDEAERQVRRIKRRESGVT